MTRAVSQLVTLLRNYCSVYAKNRNYKSDLASLVQKYYGTRSSGCNGSGVLTTWWDVETVNG